MPDDRRLRIRERRIERKAFREQIGPLWMLAGLRGNASSRLGGDKDLVVGTKSYSHTIIPEPGPRVPQCPDCDGAVTRIEMEMPINESVCFAAYCENGHRWEPAWTEDERELLTGDDR